MFPDFTVRVCVCVCERGYSILCFVCVCGKKKGLPHFSKMAAERRAANPRAKKKQQPGDEGNDARGATREAVAARQRRDTVQRAVAGPKMDVLQQGRRRRSHQLLLQGRGLMKS